MDDVETMYIQADVKKSQCNIVVYAEHCEMNRLGSLLLIEMSEIRLYITNYIPLFSVDIIIHTCIKPDPAAYKRSPWNMIKEELIAETRYTRSQYKYKQRDNAFEFILFAANTHMNRW